MGELREEGEAEGGGRLKGVAVQPVPFPHRGLEEVLGDGLLVVGQGHEGELPRALHQGVEVAVPLEPHRHQGGWKEAWVTQFTVPAATSSPSWAVRT